MIFFKRWYINEITSSKIPSMINAAILPPSEILLMSDKNNFNNAREKRLSEIILNVLYLYLIPSHIITKENTAHTMVSPAFTYCALYKLKLSGFANKLTYK